MKKQAFNPFLPLNEYIPDGEPHVFDDRVYLFGSHDAEGGRTYCMLDYVSYSAPVDDLSDWRCEGVIYRAVQDPDYEQRPFMYAPDVVKGNDGRYYLYYCMSGEFGQGGYHGPIQVAVCDTPAGKYEYLGCVQYPDGTPMQKYVCFDPGVINDDGVIRLYYGTRYPYEEDCDISVERSYLEAEMTMFGKTAQEILSTPESVMGPNMVVLEDDMITVKEEPKHIISYAVKGTSFEEHPFYEGASIRKIKDTYYFIYSSLQNHELCYATSKYPDRDFVFRGTIVSNGDIGYRGRTSQDRVNMTGTTHGSIEKINGTWYVFYHRLTHKSDYSRQACAQKIVLKKDGTIPQVEITSCGFNDGPLKGEGTYSSVIACNLTNGNMPHGSNRIYTDCFPNVTHEIVDEGHKKDPVILPDGSEYTMLNSNSVPYVAEITDGTLIGYKYFDFRNLRKIAIEYQAESDAEFEIRVEEKADAVAKLVLSQNDTWSKAETCVSIPDGVYPVFLVYHGKKTAKLKSISFIR